MGRWELFKYRSFIMYWLGYVFSAMGDVIFLLVVSWLIVQKTGSGAGMGTFLLFVGIPRVIFMLIGGVIVDRKDDFPPQSKGTFSDMLAGLKFIRQKPLLLIIISTAIFGNAAMSTVTVGPPFLADEYNSGAKGLANMSASVGDFRAESITEHHTS